MNAIEMYQGLKSLPVSLTLAAVLEAVGEKRGIGTNEIADRLHRPRATAVSALAYYRDNGFLRSMATGKSTGGAPECRWYLTPEGRKTLHAIRRQLKKVEKALIH